MITWQLIVSILIALLAIISIIIGAKMILGSIDLSGDKKEKWAIGAIVTSIVIGLGNLIWHINPKLRKSDQKMTTPPGCCGPLNNDKIPEHIRKIFEKS